jgi:hypothetical protein
VNDTRHQPRGWRRVRALAHRQPDRRRRQPLAPPSTTVEPPPAYLLRAQGAVGALNGAQLAVIAHQAAGGTSHEFLNRTGWTAGRYWAESSSAHSLLRTRLAADGSPGHQGPAAGSGSTC